MAMWSSGRARNSATSASMPTQILNTVERDTPESQPSTRTGSSTFLVDVSVMYAVMITAHYALSRSRRGSSNDGYKLPTRNFEIPSSTSPAGVDRVRERAPLRCFERVSVRSGGLRAGPSRQLGIDQVLHPSFHQPTKQIGRVDISEASDEVANSGIIFMGHRVHISFGDYLVLITESHAMAHPTGGPSNPHFHHSMGRQL